MLFALVFGSRNPENSESSVLLMVLFLIPFVATGMATFLSGLFISLGKTVIEIRAERINLERSLFGKVFKHKQLINSDISLRFEESHEENEQPRYKICLSAAAQKISFGGSLKEAELRWLHQEIAQVLGKEITEASDIKDSIEKAEIEAISSTKKDPDYRSQNLHFSKSPLGWEAHYRFRFGSGLSLILTGLFFILLSLIL